MSRSDLTDKYIEQKLAGTSYSEIRSSLKNEGLDDEEIKLIIGLVDRYVVRDDVSKANTKRGKEIMYGGLILALAGLVITVFTFTGAINMGKYYLVAYGPILGGASTVAYGSSLIKKARE